MGRAVIERMSPFFIVTSVSRSLAFYGEALGFETWHREPQADPVFAIAGRDGAMLFIKSGDVRPQPNPSRDADMRWDAYLSTQAPDDLAAEFVERGAVFSSPLQDTHDGLRGFEVTDPDGYVLFFGRPR